MGKTKRIIRTIIIVLIVLVIVCVIATAGLSVYIYDQNFNCRFDTYEPLSASLDDFDGLSRTKYEVESDKGQKLAGYMYTADTEPHGILIIAHGFGGGGHNSYMDVADYFAHHGYYVFAYDATGCDESEGEGVGGLSQGLIDLDHVISYLEDSDEFPDLPIVLFGHSWGGYCVSSVLAYHPEVKAVIECSGFNSASDMFKIEGKSQAGSFIYAMMPFVNAYDRIKFGKYADTTALDGFASSETPVMIVHSEDDNVVPIGKGYDLYYEKYKDDQRFTFMKLRDAGHNYCFSSKEGRDYIDEFNAGFDSFRESLTYDISLPENKDRFAAEKAAYLKEHLDRDIYFHMLDEDLFAQFLDFYDKNI